VVHNSDSAWLNISLSIRIGFRDMEYSGEGPGQGVTPVIGRVRDIAEGGGGDIPDFTQMR
jgi:hypothetical protein